MEMDRRLALLILFSSSALILALEAKNLDPYKVMPLALILFSFLKLYMKYVRINMFQNRLIDSFKKRREKKNRLIG